MYVPYVLSVIINENRKLLVVNKYFIMPIFRSVYEREGTGAYTILCK